MDARGGRRDPALKEHPDQEENGEMRQCLQLPDTWHRCPPAPPGSPCLRAHLCRPALPFSAQGCSPPAADWQCRRVKACRSNVSTPGPLTVPWGQPEAPRVGGRAGPAGTWLDGTFFMGNFLPFLPRLPSQPTSPYWCHLSGALGSRASNLLLGTPSLRSVGTGGATEERDTAMAAPAC